MSDTLFQKIVEDATIVAGKIGLKAGDPFGRRDYLNNGARFTKDQLYEAGGWSPICTASGYTTKATDEVPDDEYFRRLGEATRQLGRYPGTYERKKYGLNCAKSRFATLTDLIRAAIEAGKVPDLRNK